MLFEGAGRKTLPKEIDVSRIWPECGIYRHFDRGSFRIKSFLSVLPGKDFLKRPPGLPDKAYLFCFQGFVLG